MALGQNIVVLIGGVGGAKLASGLLQVVPAENLTFVVNTGDDFWHMGLRICPDLDTLMYTLSGLVDPERGWGIRDDTTTMLDALNSQYLTDTWFRLGDKDLATHLYRSHLLKQGHTLTEATHCLKTALGIKAALLPMCDAEAPTMIETKDMGLLGFQEYFVKYRWQPVVKSILHQGCEHARISMALRSKLEEADFVLIAPSNPWLSLAPVLAVPGMRELLAGLSAPIVAVTPIVAGAAVKGPTAKIMLELGLDVSAATIVKFYAGIIDGFVDDIRNEPLTDASVRTVQLDTMMHDEERKSALAQATLAWIEGWGS